MVICIVVYHSRSRQYARYHGLLFVNGNSAQQHVHLHFADGYMGVLLENLLRGDWLQSNSRSVKRRSPHSACQEKIFYLWNLEVPLVKVKFGERKLPVNISTVVTAQSPYVFLCFLFLMTQFVYQLSQYFIQKRQSFIFHITFTIQACNTELPHIFYGGLIIFLEPF